jgi:hypothetical protein
VEAYVRASWDERKGTPGLFVSDPILGQRLATNYDGWFAGVPIRTNNLGFRADGDYELRKGPRTFRILVLGDSVTFGHGSVHTYPALLEQLLRQWRGDIDWQVWNAAVPGYNTSQELAQLLELGPMVQPDLVVVGFFENDIIGNEGPRPATALERWRSRALAVAQRHVYSLELYKRVYLQAAWLLSRSSGFAQRLEHLGTEDALLARSREIENAAAQRITDYERLDEATAHAPRCLDGEQPDPAVIREIEQRGDWEEWLRAVRGFQQLHARGDYRIIFFLNIVPPICGHLDLFYPGASGMLNEFYTRLMGGAGGPWVASAYETFLHRRPSEMPAARAHAIGNSNMSKAEALFAALSTDVLPHLLAGRASAPPRD